MTAVLFVDDDEANLVVCEASISDEFDVLTALTAEAALELMSQHEVAVLVADQRMPGTTGVELLEAVKDRYPQTIRILITAYSDLKAAIDAINRGHVRRYLRKPWEPEELRHEIRDALDVYDMSCRLSALERRLRETERVYSLGVVVAGIAHELRNPVSWVSGNLSQALEELRSIGNALSEGGDPVSLRSRIKELEDSLDDASLGVQRIIDLVRGIELPTRQTAAEVVDLGEVLRLTLRLVRSEIQSTANLELDVGAAPRVRGSSTQLGQVVLNLVVNAIQALSGRPRDTSILGVSLSVVDHEARLVVSDNGEGISEANLQRIFDPFFTTKPDVGTGLGLAISRTIVQELGGTLQARNKAGGGAEFVLALPLAAH